MVVPSENIKLFVFDGKYLIMSFELTSVEDLMNLTNIYAVFFRFIQLMEAGEPSKVMGISTEL